MCAALLPDRGSARSSAPRRLTLLLHGERDGIVPPAHSHWLASRIPVPNSA
ncbi:hypothetical protein ACSHWB_25235 [Lentzea sp. HUAS TT2]|uniref:hypothetical protein n=1 Tax=Lentzea sp. HUAS TT2 TaxID=3447454 RepID=UPI003F721EF1